MPGQTGPKRTPMQREADLLKIAEWYCQGWGIKKIAEKIGVSFQQISNDLVELRKRWKERASGSIEEQKLAELAKIDNLERVYWEQFEASKVNEGTPQGYKGWVDSVQWCIDTRAKIFGIYAPTKTKNDTTVTIDPVAQKAAMERAKKLLLKKAIQEQQAKE